MSKITLLDDNTRPKAPPIEGVTPEQRRLGRQLASIHRIHLSTLEETRVMMARVEAGEMEASALSAKIESLEMLNNYRSFGNLCGRECHILNFHHASEDQNLFPLLHQKGSDPLKRVVERLTEEHVVVHALLVQLADRTNDLLSRPGPESFAATKETFSTLYRVVLSHFGYEEEQLLDAIGYHGIDYR